MPHRIAPAISLAACAALVSGCMLDTPVDDAFDEPADGNAATYTMDHHVGSGPVAAGSTLTVQLGELYGQFPDRARPFQPDFVIMDAASSEAQVMTPRTDFETREKMYQDLVVEAHAPGQASVTATVGHDDEAQLDETFDFTVVDPARVELDFGCPKTSATPTLLNDDVPVGQFSLTPYDAQDNPLQGDLREQFTARSASGQTMRTYTFWQRQEPHMFHEFDFHGTDRIIFESQHFGITQPVDLAQAPDVDGLAVTETWRNQRGPGEFRKVDFAYNLEVSGSPVCDFPRGYPHEVEGRILTDDLCAFTDGERQFSNLSTQHRTFTVRSTDDTTQGTCRFELTFAPGDGGAGVTTTHEFAL